MYRNIFLTLGLPVFEMTPPLAALAPVPVEDIATVVLLRVGSVMGATSLPFEPG